MHPDLAHPAFPTTRQQHSHPYPHTPPRRHCICKPPPAHPVHCRKTHNLPLLFSPYQLQGTPNPHGHASHRFPLSTCMTLSILPSGCDAVQGVLALHCNTANKIWQQRLNPINTPGGDITRTHTWRTSFSLSCLAFCFLASSFLGFLSSVHAAAACQHVPWCMA